MAIRSDREVGISLRLTLISAAVVAIVAVLQARNLFNVPGFLTTYFDDPFEGASGADATRASSTIASSFGLADVMAMCLAIVVAWLSLGRPPRVLVIVGGGLFLIGCVAAGSFSGFIGCGVALVAVGFATRKLGRLLALAVPAVVVAAVGVWPVIATRLAGFDNRLALPHSWTGRLENLEQFFWPELFSGFNWIVGVRPAARVAAPEAWRNWVYIESGYTWLLWTGGVALFATFLAFAVIILRQTLRTARNGRGAVRVAAATAFAAMAMMTVLMLFDAHLTVRGAADLFFPLIALASAEFVANRRSELTGRSAMTPTAKA
jgi:hypothetical protein